jgi:hypothetical protein
MEAKRLVVVICARSRDAIFGRGDHREIRPFEREMIDRKAH